MLRPHLRFRLGLASAEPKRCEDQEKDPGSRPRFRNDGRHRRTAQCRPKVAGKNQEVVDVDSILAVEIAVEVISVLTEVPAQSKEIPGAHDTIPVDVSSSQAGGFKHLLQSARCTNAGQIRFVDDTVVVAVSNLNQSARSGEH